MKIRGKKHPVVRVWCKQPKKIAHRGDILLSVRAPIGAVNIADCDCCIGRGLAAISPIDQGNIDYYYFLLKALSRELKLRGTGSTFKAIGKKSLENLHIPKRTFYERKAIANNLLKVEQIIWLYEEELNCFDELIKARFVEMFGEPIRNTAHISALPMTEVCKIIDGDRGKKYPKQEDFLDDGYCLFLNAKNVTNHGFDFSECMFITKEKDEDLRKGKLNRGDIVLTTRGTIGNLALYSNDIPFEHVRINSGMVILRINRNIIDEQFFIEQFRMQIDNIKQSVASGSAQPQLPISTMNKISIIIPELKLQKQFSAFVVQIDKSKQTSILSTLLP